MDTKRQLAFSIIKHLKSEVTSGSHSEDIAESLEVAIQCLEQAYNINLNEQELGLGCIKSLLEIFHDGTKVIQDMLNYLNKDKMEVRINTTEDSWKYCSKILTYITPQQIPETSESSKMIAEQLKGEGNEQMKNGLYQEAADTYTRAIQVDSHNAVYFSNRAAAFTKLGQNDKAIDDCKKAVGIDPNFSRAHGRMGLAQMNMEMFVDARESYKKALSLDPGNSGYQQNLDLIEQKLSEKKGPNLGAGPGGLPNLAGMDIGSLLSNPAVMNMAQSFMQNPQMQQMFSNMMGGGNPSATGEDGPADPSPGTNQPSFNMQDIFGATQNFAQQMSNDNPELVQQLKNQFRGPNPDSDKENK